MNEAQDALAKAFAKVPEMLEANMEEIVSERDLIDTEFEDLLELKRNFEESVKAVFGWQADELFAQAKSLI